MFPGHAHGDPPQHVGLSAGTPLSQHRLITCEEVQMVAPSYKYESSLPLPDVRRPTRPARILSMTRGINGRILGTRFGIDFNQGEWKDVNSSTSCSICISDFCEKDVLRKIKLCEHTFHAKCIEKWLVRYQARCPLCNLELSDLSRKTGEV